MGANGVLTDKPAIDCHVHAWKLSRLPAVLDNVEVRSKRPDLLLDFYPESMIALAEKSGIGGVLFVQACDPDDDALAEADWLSNCWRKNTACVGIVAGVDLREGDAVRAHLENLKELGGIVGLRMIRPENDGVGILSSKTALHAAKAIAEYGYSLDVLVRSATPGQLEEVESFMMRAAEAAPTLSIIADHLLKPVGLSEGRPLPEWRATMQRLGKEKHFFMKLSACRGEAGPSADRTNFFPFYDEALFTFGEDFLIFGSDNPVSYSYADSVSDVLEWIERQELVSSSSLRNRVFHENGKRAYRLIPRN